MGERGDTREAWGDVEGTAPGRRQSVRLRWILTEKPKSTLSLRPLADAGPRRAPDANQREAGGRAGGRAWEGALRGGVDGQCRPGGGSHRAGGGGEPRRPARQLWAQTGGSQGPARCLLSVRAPDQCALVPQCGPAGQPPIVTSASAATIRGGAARPAVAASAHQLGPRAMLPAARPRGC